MSFIARILLLLGGVVTSWFIAKDANNFHLINFVVTLFLFVFLFAAFAFRQDIIGWVKEVWRRIQSR